MEHHDRENGTAKDHSFDLGSFRPEDALGIGRLFREVYGEDYPIRVFYNEHDLAEANATGQYCSIVARTNTGEVAGVVHVFRSAPYDKLYEVGSGLVSPKYRNRGLNGLLMRYAVGEWMPAQSQIEEGFGEPVCNHTTNQKACIAFGYVETALEVALMPASAYEKERSAQGRVAALLAFRCYVPKLSTVYLPAPYEEELRFIYSGLDDKREFKRAEEALPIDVISAGKVDIFDFAQVARVALHQTGSDLETYLDEVEARALARNVEVIQMWLKLASPCVGSAVDSLRQRGYFLGGALPRWFDGDGLLMQKVLCDPGFESIRLYSDRAKAIADIVRDDWKRTT